MSEGDTNSGASGRERRRARRFDALVEAAMDVVVDEGLAGLTMGELARRLDVTPGALYRYISSKDELIARLEVRIVEELGRELEESIEAATAGAASGEDEGGGLEALCAVIAASRTYRGFARRRPRRFALLGAVLGDPRIVIPDEMAAKVAAPALALLSRIGDLLEEASRAGHLESGVSFERAVLLWSSLHGLLERRKMERMVDRAPGVDALYETLLETLLAGWGASRESLDEARARLEGAGLGATI
jgi:AcrR family transcriptional regulator